MEIAVLLVVAGIVVLVQRRRRRWSAGIEAGGGASSWRPSGGSGWPVDTAVRSRTALSLARREARLLLAHPAFVIGALVLTALFLLVLARFEADGYEPIAGDTTPQLMCVLAAWGAIVAANLATLRSRRYRTDELFASLPSTPSTRTSGHLVACLAGLPVGVIVLGATVMAGRSRGYTGWPLWLDVAIGPLLVVGGGVVGVLVARWLPWSGLAYAAVVATMVLQANIWHQDDIGRWLHFSRHTSYSAPAYLDHFAGRLGWHVVYVVGLIALGALLALVRDGWSRATGALGVTAAVLLVPSVLAQVQPYSDADVARIVARLDTPEAHQTCVEKAGVTYCAYRNAAGYADSWEGPVSAVLANVPASARPTGLVVRLQPTEELLDNTLLDGVRDWIEADPARVWHDDGEVHVSGGVGDDPGVAFRLAYRTASAVVGLPVSWTAGVDQCVAAGQARSVATLWLAAMAAPSGTESLSQLFDDGAGRRLVTLDYADTDGAWIVHEQGTVVDPADVEGAVRLLGRPMAEVRNVLAEHWDEVVDPGTPAAALLAWARADGTGLGEPVGGAPTCPTR